VNARFLKVQIILEPPAAHQRVGCARPRGPWPVGRRGSRNVEKLAPLAAEIGAEGFAVDPRVRRWSRSFRGGGY
jgi:hypothetical protein